MATNDPPASHWNFDKYPDRSNTSSLKWNRWKDHVPPVIPMWVADGDFETPSFIVDALHGRVNHPIFGYTVTPRSVKEALVGWLHTRFSWDVPTDALVFVPGVVTGMNMFMRAIGKPGDGVIVNTPSYPPFLSSPGHHGQILQPAPLGWDESKGFFMDPKALEDATTPQSKSYILCQPHNPSGRVFTLDELKIVVEHCKRHNLYILSDEIWADLILDGSHIPFAKCPEAKEILDRTITLMAPSKTFNVPGLGCAVAICTNPELKRKFIGAGRGIVPDVNLLGFTAAEAAWKNGEAWLGCLLEHLRKNRELISATLSKLPNLRWHAPQATYLAWIDARKTGQTNPANYLLEYGVGLSDGADFAAPGWIRLNFACPTSTLEQALAKIVAAFTK